MQKESLRETILYIAIAIWIIAGALHGSIGVYNY